MRNKWKWEINEKHFFCTQLKSKFTLEYSVS